VNYQVRPSAKAIKEIERMDRATMKGVQGRIDELALNPFDHRLAKQLEMAPGRRYSGVGD
jgi:mRNA-degrading endonuclease RelE of RelBE toxin-antitoxin system